MIEKHCDVTANHETELKDRDILIGQLHKQKMLSFVSLDDL